MPLTKIILTPEQIEEKRLRLSEYARVYYSTHAEYREKSKERARVRMALGSEARKEATRVKKAAARAAAMAAAVEATRLARAEKAETVEDEAGDF